MADKYGFVEAMSYGFECDFNGERVTMRCTGGSDIDGWVDLLPVDEDGKVTSVEPERHHGDVVFSDVRYRNSAGRLAAVALTELSEYKHEIRLLQATIHDLKERLAQLRLDFNEMEEAFSGPRADRGATIIVGGDEMHVPQGRFQ